MMGNGRTLEERVILFMDIHDFSIVMNELGGESIDFLQAVYERLGDLIVDYDGEILKYLGDAMLCIFPADSEGRAIECSYQLRAAYHDLTRQWGIAHETDLEIGLGSGEVEVGRFGHKSLRVKDVFGEEVNRAATIGHHRGIAITEGVYQKVNMSHETRRLPDCEVKWQEEGLKVWEVVE